MAKTAAQHRQARAHELMRRCAWHECGLAFEPTDPRQAFCCPSCRKARGAWKARRGGPLVDLLLAGDGEALIVARHKIMKEVYDAIDKKKIENAATKTD